MKPFLKPLDSHEPATQSGSRVLNAGSGPRSSRQLHSVFRDKTWREVRVDIDPRTEPDLIGSITDMSAFAPARSFDAVWSSHSLEHLHAHEVPLALSEFRRVLKPDGFALITSPDLEAVASALLEHGLDHVAYISPSGPITPRDMLFGHGDSIARGKLYMAHNTGLTSASLGKLLLDAGFPTVLAKRERLDLWVVALMEKADKVGVQRRLKAAGLDMFDDV
ncbi:class I SAM-dependent methyltransferase [Methylocapsa sp. S129]|uniref:class I SAM-dependent methyltransferase n=1 Tax=Methylocapsa sp. S129 TaxID=1641869 RepID=UPI00131E5BCA|nr:class I SAM-dependent methyltransferase [Methylocapsa sp. S129]